MPVNESKHVDIVTHSPEETRRLGLRIGLLAQPGDVYLLIGDLGAGKTCLTQGIAWGLGIQEYAMSPTFVIVRELYGRLPLYHMDLYRLDRTEEMTDLGLDDYLYGRGVSVVEWAEKAMNIMPRERLVIRISYISENQRRFRLEPSGERYRDLAAQLSHVSFGGEA